MNKDDIEKAVKEAEAHAEEDKNRKELVDTKNMADRSVFAIEKLVRDNGEKLSAEDKKTLTDACERLKKDIADDKDVDSVKKKVEEFSKSSQAIVMKLYQDINQINGAAGTEGGNPDEVVHE
jgi:molecular chaperone DnaK